MKNKNQINLEIECQSCNGTGVYSGFAESKDVAVICYQCKGTGKFNYKFSYKKFTGLKKKKGIKRVYKSGTPWKIGLGILKFETKKDVIEVDMDKEGVSYDEFINGKIPDYIKKLQCPMSADQGSCSFEFKDICNEIHGEYLSYIPDCNHENKLECWERFEITNKK